MNFPGANVEGCDGNAQQRCPLRLRSLRLNSFAMVGEGSLGKYPGSTGTALARAPGCDRSRRAGRERLVAIAAAEVIR
jgi:hypothetical protein